MLLYTVLLSSRKVLVLEAPRQPIYKSLSLSLFSNLKSLSLKHKSLSLDHKVLEYFEDSTFCKQSFTGMYDHMKSKNFVTDTVYEVTVKNGLLTYWYQILLTYWYIYINASQQVPIYLQPFTSYNEILVGNCNFFLPPAFIALVGGVSIGILGKIFVLIKLESWGYQAVKTVWR